MAGAGPALRKRKTGRLNFAERLTNLARKTPAIATLSLPALPLNRLFFN